MVWSLEGGAEQADVSPGDRPHETRGGSQGLEGTVLGGSTGGLSSAQEASLSGAGKA